MRARDSFISLPGTNLAIGNDKEFELIMDSAATALRNYMDKGSDDKIIKEIEAPDVLLWATWTIQQYSKYTSKDRCLEKYGSLLNKILSFILSGKDQGLLLHSNYLLYTMGTEKAASWMNAMENGRPVTPRSGYLGECNAPLYNPLMFATCLFN